MKKLISAILAFSFICFSAVPVAFAEETEGVYEDLYGKDIVDEHLAEPENPEEQQATEIAGGNVPVVSTTVGTSDNTVQETTEEEVIEVPKAKFEKESSILAALGIFKFDDFSKTITRGEFVAAVAKLCGYNGAKDSASNYFNDIPDRYEYDSQVAYAAGLKLIQGDGNGFRATEPILMEEAGFIMLRALGYDKFSPYITIDMVKAREEGIYDGISLSGKVALTYDYASRVIYNAMNLEMILVKGTTFDGLNNAMVLAKDGTTLLNYYLKTYMTEGVVTDNGKTSFTGDSTVAEHRAIIGDMVFNKGNVDLWDLLGYEVEAYYDEDDTLLYVYDITKEGDVLYFTADEIISADSNSIRYENESGKIRAANIATAAKIIYNGKALKPGEYRDELLKPEIGTVKLIRTKGSSAYSVVVISSEYNCVVNKVNVSVDYICRISDMYSTDKNVSFDVNDIGKNVRIVDESGKLIAHTDIETCNILSVAKSLDGEVISIKVSANKLGGVIEGISNDGETVITVKGKKYKISYGADTTFVIVNVYGDCYFDVYGNVAYFNSYSQYEERYGYLVRVRVLEDEIPTFIIKVFDSYGKMYTFAAEEKLIVDGNTVKGNDFAAVAESFYSGGDFQPTIIRYELNLNGSLKAIDTCVQGTGATGDMLREIQAPLEQEYPHTGAFVGMRRYEANVNMFDGQIFMDSNTIILGIPRGRAAEDQDYQLLKLSYFVNGRYYDIKAYTHDEYSDMAKVVIVKYSEKYDLTDPAMRTPRNFILLPGFVSTAMNTAVAEDIFISVDENGEIVHNVTFTDMANGTQSTLPVRWQEQTAGLERGMVFRYCAMNSRLIDIEPVFDLNTRTAESARIYRDIATPVKTFYVRQNDRDVVDQATTLENSLIAQSTWRLAYLDVLSTKGGILKGVAGKASDYVAGTIPEEYVDRAPISKIPRVYKYDTRTQKLVKVTSDDLYGYDDLGDDCSKVVVVYARALPRAVIILE